MPPAHWSQSTALLIDALAAPRFGIISDFDGTLAPFTGVPAASRITPDNAAALDALAPRVSVIALVSGRGAADLRDRFTRTWAVYYGNHGMEWWEGDGVRIDAAAAAHAAALAALLDAFGQPDIDGVIVEPKGVTASVHYRKAADPDAARAALLARLEPLVAAHGFALSEGQYIWEIKPPVALDKGTAALAIVEQHALDGILFLGDDVTDFAAMRALRGRRAAGGLRAVSVGVTHPTSRPELYAVADVTADGVDDTARLLSWLGTQLTQRQPHDT